MHLNEAARAYDGLEVVCNLHEQASAISAEAYGRLTGTGGLAIVTTGPGSTNAITGLLGAWQDSTPCVFLSGQVKRPDLIGDSGLRQRGVQEVDIISMVRSITKYAVTILEPSTTRFHLEKALHLALSGRPGPVWIDVPLDVQASQIEWEGLSGYEPDATAVRVDLSTPIAKTISLLQKAERPVFLAGNGIRVAGARQLLIDAIEKIGIPVLTTWPATDIFDSRHPLYFGRPGGIAPRGANFTVQNCDFLLAVGARLDLPTTGYSHQNFARAAKKIIVDIDPAELKKFKMPVDVPICSDAKDFLNELLRAASNSGGFSSWEPWKKRCREWKTKYPLVTDENRKADGPIGTLFLSETMCSVLDEDACVVITSAGAASELFYLAFQAKGNQRVIHNRGTGAMGFALPQAIGACYAFEKKKRIICVDGDGGIQFNVQELATIAAYKLPITIFVMSNAGYASIRASQKRYFGQMIGADAQSGLHLPDIEKVSQAYGIPTSTVTRPAELKEVIQSALKHQGPFLCNIEINPSELRAPCLSSRQLADGSMVSTPLEDLWPFLDRKEFLENMIIPPLPESIAK